MNLKYQMILMNLKYHLNLKFLKNLKYQTILNFR
jgi:hypothetical protein